MILEVIYSGLNFFGYLCIIYKAVGVAALERVLETGYCLPPEYLVIACLSGVGRGGADRRMIASPVGTMHHLCIPVLLNHSYTHRVRLVVWLAQPLL